MQSATAMLLASGAFSLLLAACTDDASVCREPGYLCADHVSAKDRICVLPGYTCSPDEASQGEGIGPAEHDSDDK